MIWIRARSERQRGDSTNGQDISDNLANLRNKLEDKKQEHAAAIRERDTLRTCTVLCSHREFQHVFLFYDFTTRKGAGVAKAHSKHGAGVAKATRRSKHRADVAKATVGRGGVLFVFACRHENLGMIIIGPLESIVGVLTHNLRGTQRCTSF